MIYVLVIKSHSFYATTMKWKKIYYLVSILVKFSNVYSDERCIYLGSYQKQIEMYMACWNTAKYPYLSFSFVYDNSMLHPLIPPAVKIYLCLCFNSGFTDHGCVEIKIRISYGIAKYGQN